MKKYFFALMFIFSVFFFGLNSNVVNAEDKIMNFTVSLADSYDNRIVDITVSEYNVFARAISITELAVCSEQEQDSCQKYAKAKNADTDMSDKYMKVVGEIVGYEIPFAELEGEDYTARYTVQTQSDGDIYILIQCLNGSGAPIGNATMDSAFGIYKLSTLNQRIVINADAMGRPTYSYDHVQFTKVRNNEVNIELFDSEYNEFSGEVYICEYFHESEVCTPKYTIGKNVLSFYIRSVNDGEKTINFHLVRKGKTVTNNEFTEDNSLLITKLIVLDETGPKITLNGGQWAFVKSGSRYKEQTATCEDATFPTDTCKVENDLKVVRIDYNSDKYQLVTYSATDRLGNVSSVVVKVKVEIIKKDNSTLIALLASGGVLLVTIAILGVVVYNNHQKKKKLSYI